MRDKPAASASIMFEPVQTHRTFEVVSNRIRQKLADGELKPGDKLPAERDMAKQLNVSRSAVREALRSLEIAGVVRLQKGAKGGAFIEAGTPGRMTQALQDLVHLDAISLRDLTEARIVMLESVVRLAVTRAKASDLAALEANIDRTEQATRDNDMETRLECAYEFYHLLASATQNRAIVYMVDSQTAIVQTYLNFRKRRMPDNQLINGRRTFLKHLRARDADAAVQEMARHLTKVHQILWKERGTAGRARGGSMEALTPA